MKNKSYRLFITAFLLTLIGLPTCKNKDLDVDSFEIERESVVTTADSVKITGSYSFAGTVKRMKVNIGEKESLIDANAYEMQMEGTDFSVSVGGLKPSTDYYYRYSIDFGTNDAHLTETKSFTTLDALPTVKTLEVLAIDSTTFRIKCEVVSDGGQEVTERGICFNNYGDPTMDDETMQHANGGLGIYTIRMENLALGKKYYVRAYAKNAANKIGLSEEALDFETGAPAGMPVEIELGCNPEEGGSVTGGGTYEVGVQCTVTAEANTGYTFVNWTENDAQVSSEASYTFPVTVSRSLVANFTMQAYVITAEVTPENSGTITGAGGFNYGEACTLTATPYSGYEFVKWTKGGTTVSSDAEYTFTVSESATYKAHFKVKSYSISVSASPNNGGSVNGGGTFNHGHSCTVHATPADGFVFANWTDEGDVVSEEADYTFPVTSNRTLVAHFTLLQPNEYSIIVSANPNNGGIVTGGGTYQQGQNCTVTAISRPGYTFLKWTEDGQTVQGAGASYTFTVTGNRTLVAQFQISYTIHVSANPSYGGTVNGGGTYQQGAQCTVTATATVGHTFTNWTENGTVISNNATYSFTVMSDRTLVANFIITSYTISVSSNPTNGGTAYLEDNYGTTQGTYPYGQICKINAAANTGYTFTNWTENGDVVSTNSTYSFQVTGNRTLVANFQSTVPQGAINGQFTINANSDKVYFSQGNLQYNKTTQVWSFMEHQYDMVETQGQNVGENYANQNIISLFGWGTSGYHYPYDPYNVNYQPWSTLKAIVNETYNCFGYGPSTNMSSPDLTGSSVSYDWGVFNTISNGGVQAGLWRTLTSNEWAWVCGPDSNPTPGTNCRTSSTVNGTANARFTKATVNGISGVVLFPDNYTHPSESDVPESINVSEASFAANNWSGTAWTAMENAGCVFLPAAGFRYETSVNSVGNYCFYWSASHLGSTHAYFMDSSDSSLHPQNAINRFYGISVRLVHSVQ